MAPIIRLGAVLGFVGVAFGAFGTHALKSHLTSDQLAVWHTAVEYHLAHSLAAVLAGTLGLLRPNRLTAFAGWLFSLGVVIFSGSLYTLALTGIRVFGAVTPLGGLCFLVAWICLAAAPKAEKA